MTYLLLLALACVGWWFIGRLGAVVLRQLNLGKGHR